MNQADYWRELRRRDALADDDSPRLTEAELRDKYGGENWGLQVSDPPTSPPQPTPSWDAITAAYAAAPGRLAKLLPEHHEAAE